jgi:hypothetical protein
MALKEVMGLSYGYVIIPLGRYIFSTGKENWKDAREIPPHT